MVFFQAALLLGYAYAHFSTRWLGLRQQALAHLGLLLLPLAVLPLSLTGKAVSSIPQTENPIPWLLCFLAIVTGLPSLSYRRLHHYCRSGSLVQGTGMPLIRIFCTRPATRGAWQGFSGT